MPALSETAPRTLPRVGASAVFELMWLVHNCEADHELVGAYASQEPIRERFGDSAKQFWADGVRGATDVVILAVRSATILDLDLDRFFDRFDEAATQGSDESSMLSETPFERVAYAERLRKLHADPDVRRRYRDLLQALWDAAKGEWRERGRSAATAAAEQWSKRLEADPSFEEVMRLLERKQLWKGRPEFDEMAERALADGRLVLSPGWFYGEIHLVELDGDVYVGHGVMRPGDEEQKRRAAGHVASRLKSLADPTRLSILLSLAQEPSSVTELARRLKLSQPTVSGHVQILREAGLLDEKAAGRSARLSTNEEAVRRFLGTVEDDLLRFLR